MAKRKGLRSRLGRAFVVQALLISAAALVGVYAAGFTLEDVLIKQALEDEATYFWTHYQEDPNFPTPDTHNLTGYLATPDERGGLPVVLRDLTDGFSRTDSSTDLSMVYVTQRMGKRLYLVFDGERVRELAVFFGLVPLGLVLVVLYLVTWLVWRFSRRAVSPIEWLAREVRRLDPQAPDENVFALERLPGNPDREVEDLAEALERLTRRINEFVDRERNFTRDASHELRSPLTVIRIAADMLLSEHRLEQGARNTVLRIKRSAGDMEELTEALLLLARETDNGLTAEPVCLNDVVSEEIERARLLIGDKPVSIQSTDTGRLVIESSRGVLSVLIGNLVRNAVSYTEAGEIRVRVGETFVEVDDSGPGMPPEVVEKAFKPFFRGEGPARGGYGVGLTIVKRFCDRFGWPVAIESSPGRGTRVVIEFASSRVVD